MKKATAEGKTDCGPEEGDDEEPNPGPIVRGGGRGAGLLEGHIGSSQSVAPLQLEMGPQLHPCWKKGSSDSEFSDPEGGIQSKIRFNQI